MIVTLRSLDSIRPYPGNPRNNDPDVDAVARSLHEFGFRQPIVIDADGVIVVGHTRFKAALKLGMTKVPVHVAAETIGRRAKLELDPRYCDVIVKRWEGFTGRVAERVPGAADVAVPASVRTDSTPAAVSMAAARVSISCRSSSTRVWNAGSCSRR